MIFIFHDFKGITLKRVFTNRITFEAEVMKRGILSTGHEAMVVR